MATRFHVPRTPRPNAPDFAFPRLGAGLRAVLLGRAPEERDPPDPDERAPEPPDDRGFAGVREPRAGAFPPLAAVLRFLVADPDMPPR
ncbi:hypothetical protein QRX50_25320 [Amycolatopsis carbonis]|uniref:Uncharacterized protein n=1 Tax=Amycolatopsis carbonis TaxID=715471 RepID=A0A9Y2N2S3_9PSEU|nr:hypothetical protein [Amycolatopsis sp. 2-15]WIX84249.1 hypothetical protein QRX50_25320 [Amycolatopsis sp. 2-15]